MTLFEMLGSILIGPLKLLFEVIFSVAYKVIQHPGPAILILSLAMNILVLPLYRRADAIQIEARDTENKLKDVVSHIKKTFSGDERMMILQTYYRQNNYNPLSVLSGSISLLLEIPFFMAAYQFLSGVDAFAGASFGPITDLSAPDGLLHFGGLTVNALPIIMTLVNVISSSLYLKGFPLKTKIQLYGMALFFLVFLYNAPAALVFYWTLNNLFSLVKTLFYRIKHAKKILNVLLGFAGAGCIYLSCVLEGFWRCSFLICLGIGLQLCWLLPLLKTKLSCKKAEKSAAAPNTKLFILGALFLTVLVGLLIPSTYVAASPQEYIDTSYFYAPIWYVVQSLCLSTGTFMVWLGVFYWLANPSGKVLFCRLVWIASGVMLVNYMFFGTNLGLVSPNLIYTDGLSFTGLETFINLGVILVLAIALYLLHQKFNKKLFSVLLVGVIALTSMGGVNLAKIAKTTQETKLQIDAASAMPEFSLSKSGQNVVVIMLDRAIGPYFPYIMEENPQLAAQFDGFVNYANTLAYGACTNFAAPALFGGYEYTPVNMNLRDDMLLEDKHNEALKVLPSLFSQEGYDVTVIDPSYAGYSWIPDLSIYEDMPEVNAYLADGKFNNIQDSISTVNTRMRNFFFFSLMKTLPVALQEAIYEDGQYRALPAAQKAEVDTQAVPIAFMNAYNVLTNMDTMTHIKNGSDNTFMVLRSNATHEPVELQEPFYTPASYVDNSAYYGAEGKIITAGDSTKVLNTSNALTHYHINMSALIQLGNWFDYLRENDAYDNTRIIIVSDHGWNTLGVFDPDKNLYTTDHYRPLLLVKDFNATGFTQSMDFMTNADVPVLALSGLVENPVNPYTGNPISSDAKADPQWVILSSDFDVEINNGYQFLPAAWACVSEDVTQKSNWTYYREETVLPAQFQQ